MLFVRFEQLIEEPLRPCGKAGGSSEGVGGLEQMRLVLNTQGLEEKYRGITKEQPDFPCLSLAARVVVRIRLHGSG